MEFRGAAGEDIDVTLSEFLEQVALVSEADNLEETPNATTLLTLHAAKGLEFPIVFLTGLEDGLLPHSRSLTDGEELAEERRLLYVGLTRAKDRVYLSHAFRRTFYGDSSVTIPSRFLKDIPQELVEGRSPSASRRQSKSRVSSWPGGTSPRTYRSSHISMSSSRSEEFDRNSIEPPARKPLPQPRNLEPEYPDEIGFSESDRSNKLQFFSGQRVRHAKFGEGTVIESKLTGNDEEVTVAFPGTGIKRLVASFANLDIVE